MDFALLIHLTAVVGFALLLVKQTTVLVNSSKRFFFLGLMSFEVISVMQVLYKFFLSKELALYAALIEFCFMVLAMLFLFFSVTHLFKEHLGKLEKASAVIGIVIIAWVLIVKPIIIHSVNGANQAFLTKETALVALSYAFLVGVITIRNLFKIKERLRGELREKIKKFTIGLGLLVIIGVVLGGVSQLLHTRSFTVIALLAFAVYVYPLFGGRG